ncbi:hypothetical protein QE152_g10711 [Popillia japonica]|uniref:Uncharacterized protein n=1 Tax=Popillia japonica TaxID=7064 RepID=A0AAW1LTV6_POPJA
MRQSSVRRHVRSFPAAMLQPGGNYVRKPFSDETARCTPFSKPSRPIAGREKCDNRRYDVMFGRFRLQCVRFKNPCGFTATGFCL